MQQKTKRLALQVLAGGAALAAGLLAPRTAQAAKQWDAGTAIEFNVDGSDDPIAPSNNGDNGIMTQDYTVTRFHDKDHWIDPNEAVPNNEDNPEEDLPYSDIDTYTDAPAPGGLSHSEGSSIYTYTAPEVGGDFTIGFTGTDRSQTIGRDDSGDRHDTDNTDNWWDLDPES